MARKFLVAIDLGTNELQNAVIQNLPASSAPSGVAGRIFYDSTNNVLNVHNGTAWKPLATGGQAATTVTLTGDVSGTGSVNEGTGEITISTTATLNSVELGVDTTGNYVETVASSGGTITVTGSGTETAAVNIDLPASGVTAGAYGSTTKIPVITIDAQGRVTLASEADVATVLSVSGDATSGTIDLLTEGLTIAGGEGINTAFNDTTNTLTVSAEDATDVNKGISSFDAVDFTVASGNVTLNAERVQDIVAGLVDGGTGIDVTYNDSAAILSIDIDSTVTTNDGVQTLTNKTLGSGTTLSANMDANQNRITDLAEPVNSSDAATKNYVDIVSAEGLHVQEGVDAATNGDLATISGGTVVYDNGTLGVGATLTTTGSFEVVDGVTLDVNPTMDPNAGGRVLVKNEAAAAHNGIYYLTSATVLTRDPLFDSDAEIEGGDFVFVVGGTANAGTGWVQAATVNIIGSDAIVWSQFSGAGTYLAGAGLTLDGTTFNVGQGSGIIVNADSIEIDTAVVARKYSATIGDGVANSFTVTHSLGTRDVQVQVYDNATYDTVEVDVFRSSTAAVLISFATAPLSNAYRVVVIG